LVFATGSFYVAHAGFELAMGQADPEHTILLPPPPEYWNYKSLPSGLAKYALLI
jgi:hypothetical protein